MKQGENEVKQPHISEGMNIKESEFDALLQELGFSLYRTTDNGVRLFRGEKEGGYFEVMDASGVFSVSVNFMGKTTDIALRYKCDRVDQLRFLICSGRFGSMI